MIFRASLYRAPLGAGLLCAAALAVAPAQDAPGPKPLPLAAQAGAVGASDWALERVVLTNGKTYRGLVKSEGPTSIDFVEVHRPRGKPMFLVVRPIERTAIERLERLDEADRMRLGDRLQRHRQRTLIEAARIEDLRLLPKRRDGALVWQYDGDWFWLESTANESMTRRSIVRLEQIFTAYRQVLPPRWKAPVRLRIEIFGHSDQYHDALASLGLAIKNPAVYLQDKNLILAGSNMNQFDAALAVVARRHRKIREQLDLLVEEAPSRIQQLHETLKKNQIPLAQRQKILAAEQKKWEQQRRAARRKIAALERDNAAKFEVVAGRMFTRLAHEAFHAYLETFVYPRTSYDVPRWLNEGLAQTFEAGLLEADSLRIDNPNLTALAHLQSDLAGNRPLGLGDLLEGGSDTFLAGHADDGQTVSRAYYYSWGLAYYLAFEQGVLGSGDFEAYLDAAAGGTSAVERFEKLVGMPLAQFQRQWRKAMLGLKASP